MRYRVLALTYFLILIVSRRASTAEEPIVQGRTLSGWVDRLKNRDARARKEAARALGQFRDKGQAAVKPLIAALRDSDEEVRNSAAVALDLIGPRGKEAVELLMEVLRDKDAALRCIAALKLGRMGKEAVEPLMTALREPRSRAEASVALMVSGKDAVNALAGALQDREEQVRREAADVLQRIGWPSCFVLHHVARAALLDRDPVVRDGAGVAIVKILGSLCREDKDGKSR